MRPDADVVVVGGGVTGIAALRALARAGHSALLLEQFALGHDRGSSHGASRIFRLAYPDPSFAALARRALVGWRELEAELGERLISPTGSLDIGETAVADATALASLEIRHELLPGREAARRWPISFEPDEPVLYHPEGGTMRADRAIQGLLDGAQAAGARVLEHAAVSAIRAETGAVVLETPSGEITARAVVVAAGAWSRELIAPLDIELETTPSRETVTFYSLEGAEDIPTVIDYALVPRDHPGTDVAPYSLAAPGVGLKVGLHRGGPATNPDLPGEIDDRTVTRQREWVAHRFPAADPAPLESETCIYTNTPDQGFVVERHARIVVASACSGHGFKFAPAIAEMVTALVADAVG